MNCDIFAVAPASTKISLIFLTEVIDNSGTSSQKSIARSDMRENWSLETAQPGTSFRILCLISESFFCPSERTFSF